MEIIATEDGKQLKVVKNIEEEIASCTDKEVKKQLKEFLKEFKELKKCEEKYKEKIEPKLKGLGDKMKDFNKK